MPVKRTIRTVAGNPNSPTPGAGLLKPQWASCRLGSTSPGPNHVFRPILNPDLGDKFRVLPIFIALIQQKKRPEHLNPGQS